MIMEGALAIIGAWMGRQHIGARDDRVGESGIQEPLKSGNRETMK
jgi:hypothetical protein